MTQAELDALLRRVSSEYNALNRRQQTQVIRAFGSSRGDVADLLADYADGDGTIKRQRVNRLIRELDAVERSIRDDGTEAFETITSETSEWTTEKVAAAVGLTVTAAYLMRVKRRVERDVFRRPEQDGLWLSDRIWSTSASIRDEMAKVIRQGIIRGEGVSNIIPQIRRVHDNETWKIRRLVRTEGSTAYRSATLVNARQSERVRWVLFHEGSCGRADHHKHACYSLAREDRYRQGAGIFIPSDTDVLMPHPNCTSYISYVLEGVA